MLRVENLLDAKQAPARCRGLFSVSNQGPELVRGHLVLDRKSSSAPVSKGTNCVQRVDGTGRENGGREVNRCLERTDAVGDDGVVENDGAPCSRGANRRETDGYALTTVEATADYASLGSSSSLKLDEPGGASSCVDDRQANDFTDSGWSGRSGRSRETLHALRSGRPWVTGRTRCTGKSRFTRITSGTWRACSTGVTRSSGVTLRSLYSLRSVVARAGGECQYGN